MSVYQKENPEYFRAALSSIFHQTVPPTEVVLVCDGPLTDALNKVVSEYESCYSKDTPRSTRTDMNDRVMPDGKRDMPGTVFRIVRLAENGGLGKALKVSVTVPVSGSPGWIRTILRRRIGVKGS